MMPRNHSHRTRGMLSARHARASRLAAPELLEARVPLSAESLLGAMPGHPAALPVSLGAPPAAEIALAEMATMQHGGWRDAAAAGAGKTGDALLLNGPGSPPAPTVRAELVVSVRYTSIDPPFSAVPRPLVLVVVTGSVSTRPTQRYAIAGPSEPKMDAPAVFEPIERAASPIGVAWSPTAGEVPASLGPLGGSVPWIDITPTTGSATSARATRSAAPPTPTSDAHPGPVSPPTVPKTAEAEAAFARLDWARQQASAGPHEANDGTKPPGQQFSLDGYHLGWTADDGTEEGLIDLRATPAVTALQNSSIDSRDAVSPLSGNDADGLWGIGSDSQEEPTATAWHAAVEVWPGSAKPDAERPETSAEASWAEGSGGLVELLAADPGRTDPAATAAPQADPRARLEGGIGWYQAFDLVTPVDDGSTLADQPAAASPQAAEAAASEKPATGSESQKTRSSWARSALVGALSVAGGLWLRSQSRSTGTEREQTRIQGEG